MLRNLAHNMCETGLNLNCDGHNNFLGRAQ